MSALGDLIARLRAALNESGRSRQALTQAAVLLERSDQALLSVLDGTSDPIAEDVMALFGQIRTGVDDAYRALLTSESGIEEYLQRLGGATAGPSTAHTEPVMGEGAGGRMPPPWPVAPGVPGPARGKNLKPPNPRHTIAGAKTGEVKKDNSVYLRGYERVGRDDTRQIAAGRARWDPDTQYYEINDRMYTVKGSGRVYPISGMGIVELDRNEYAALQEIAKVDGDLSKVHAFSTYPRFINNPQAIAKAKAVYEGTYPE